MRSAISSRSSTHYCLRTVTNCSWPRRLISMPTARPAGTARKRRARLVGVRHRLPVHLQNHVAGLQHARRRAVRIDFGDDRAARVGRKLELPRHLRRHVVQRDAEARARVAAAGAAGIGLTCRLGLEVELLDPHVEACAPCPRESPSSARSCPAPWRRRSAADRRCASPACR